MTINPNNTNFQALQDTSNSNAEDKSSTKITRVAQQQPNLVQ